MKMVQLKETDKVIGKLVVVWRDNDQQPCRVTAIKEEDGELRVFYTMEGGPQKGKKFSANHDPNQEVKVYEAGEETVAYCGG